MKQFIATKLLTFIIILATAFLNSHLKDSINATNKTPAEQQEFLVLTDTNNIKLITLGYDTIFSKLYWLKIINYFGKEVASTNDYSKMNNLCEISTKLDPFAINIFEFCATVFSWFEKNPAATIKILSEGIQNNPNHWKLYYLRGFNQWYFFKDYDKALVDIKVASNFPDSPDFIKTLTARLMTKQLGPSFAVNYLLLSIKNTQNETLKKLLNVKLKQAYLALSIDMLKLAANEFYQREFRFPIDVNELLAKNYIQNIPVEPYGGKFEFNSDGSVYTTSGAKPLDFTGKTADTGILKDQFQNFKGENGNTNN